MFKLSPVLICLILLVINQTEAKIHLNKTNLAKLCNCSPNSQTVQIDLQNKSIASVISVIGSTSLVIVLFMLLII